MVKIFRKLHNKSMSLAGTKWADLVLFTLAVADASFFPLPITTFFIMFLLVKNSSIFRSVGIISLGMLSGALIAYLSGHFIWLNADGNISGFGHFILDNVPGITEKSYDKMHILYSRYGEGLLFVSSMTPLPYGIFAISSGVFNINILLFGLTTFVSMVIKYSIISLAVKKINFKFRTFRFVRLRLLTVRA
jgi:membrane protein YqaA with SNARE-associated domain